MSWLFRRLGGASLSTLALAGWLACPAAVTAGDKPAEKDESKQAEKEEKDPFEVPDGTPEELLKYIEGLRNVRPSSSTERVGPDFIKKLLGAQLSAADKILAAKPAKEIAEKAAKAKIVAVMNLVRFGDKEAAAKLDSLPDELEKLGLKELVREVKMAKLQMQLRQAMQGGAKEVGGALEQVAAMLNEGPLDEGAARLAMSAAMAAERGSKPELAIKAYKEFGKILAASSDEKIVGQAATMAGAARRLGLVGKPFKLEGATLSGRPLDWKKYRGKVVLVDFFATWCGPCRAELPNIAKNYEAFHKKGFDVVTVSVDRDRKALEDFIEKEAHPWTIILDPTDARGTDKSMSTYYGIIGIPQMMLVGKDGNVISLGVRGKQLGEKLEELLGPPDDEKADETKPTEKEKTATE